MRYTDNFNINDILFCLFRNKIFVQKSFLFLSSQAGCLYVNAILVEKGSVIWLNTSKLFRYLNEESSQEIYPELYWDQTWKYDIKVLEFQIQNSSSTAFRA